MESFVLRKISDKEWKNWKAFYPYFLWNSHSYKLYKYLLYMALFAFACFLIGDIGAFQAGDFRFIKKFYNFLMLYFLILLFVALILIPLMLRASSKISYEFTSDSIYKIRGEKRILISSYSSIEKIVLLEGLLIDIWYKNSFGIRNSFRILGSSSKEELEVIALLKSKKKDIPVLNRLF